MQFTNVTRPRRGVVNYPQKDVWNGLTFNVPEEEIRWLHGSFVGQEHNLECTLGIQDNLHMV